MENKKEKKISDSYKRYLRAVNRRPDSVLVILRSHLLAEYCLDRIILLKLPRGDIIIENNFSFWQKLILIKSLRVLPDYLIDSLKNLNKVRNDCAHALEYKISERDVDKIGRPFTDEYLELKSEHFDNIDTLLNYTIGLLTARLEEYIKKVTNFEGNK